MHSNFLKYLDEIAKQGSIRKAANVLNLTSTSVNRKILSVEEQMGVKLFDRSPEGVELTAAGKIVLEHCRKTLYDFDHVKAIIQDIRDLRSGHLSIQTIDSFTFSILPKILDRFCSEYPGISLSISAAQPDEINKAVALGTADIGINFTKEYHPDLRIVLEKAAPFGIIMRPDHPLSGKSTIELKDLDGYPLVRTIDARGNKSLLDQEMKSATTYLTTHTYTNSLAIAKLAIKSNRALGVYTQIGFMEEVANKELVFVPLTMKSLRKYRVGLIISASTNIDPLRRLFVAEADSVLKGVRFGP
ncbi:LysR family transcriptional regulator [Pseudovibrio sp. Tun.PSC04-5.I4]|uniref:LysR family transcriptional regulator n=1 Tax=Pseudovibrio sp. Tun.PSC04-5.I4 TaxID=1798213 RepID=UPI000B807D5E|nr:LysR family transcriptional regulator [Pseudovibrio sp. Tun.PSC04-5.I4]